MGKDNPDERRKSLLASLFARGDEEVSTKKAARINQENGYDPNPSIARKDLSQLERDGHLTVNNEPNRKWFSIRGR